MFTLHLLPELIMHATHIIQEKAWTGPRVKEKSYFEICKIINISRCSVDTLVDALFRHHREDQYEYKSCPLVFLHPDINQTSEHSVLKYEKVLVSITGSLYRAQVLRSSRTSVFHKISGYIICLLCFSFTACLSCCFISFLVPTTNSQSLC